jgi:ketosteroid isomerase-like protein
VKGGVMKSHNSTTFFISLLLGIIIVFSGFQAFGEDWNDSQKELWQLIENQWKNSKQHDFNAFSDYYDFEDCIEWPSSKIFPLVGKNAILKSREKWFIYDKVESYELQPINIHIVGDVAIVAYQWKYEGSMFSRSSRQMDTYIKKNNKWNFIAGMGCSCKELPICK